MKACESEKPHLSRLQCLGRCTNFPPHYGLKKDSDPWPGYPLYGQENYGLKKDSDPWPGYPLYGQENSDPEWRPYCPGGPSCSPCKLRGTC